MVGKWVEEAKSAAVERACQENRELRIGKGGSGFFLMHVNFSNVEINCLEQLIAR